MAPAASRARDAPDAGRDHVLEERRPPAVYPGEADREDRDRDGRLHHLAHLQARVGRGHGEDHAQEEAPAHGADRGLRHRRLGGHDRPVLLAGGEGQVGVLREGSRVGSVHRASGLVRAGPVSSLRRRFSRRGERRLRRPPSSIRRRHEPGRPARAAVTVACLGGGSADETSRPVGLLVFGAGAGAGGRRLAAPRRGRGAGRHGGGGRAPSPGGQSRRRRPLRLDRPPPGGGARRPDARPGAARRGGRPRPAVARAGDAARRRRDGRPDDIARLLRARGARGSGKSIGDPVCVRSWAGDGYCAVVLGRDATRFELQRREIVGCGRGCAREAACSGGRVVGPGGLAAGDRLWVSASCLTHTGLR